MSVLLGWIGSVCFALTGLPLAVRCTRRGHANDLSLAFLAFWCGGEICYIAAVLLEFGWVSWLMANYILNLVWITIIVRYRLCPRCQ